MKKLNFVLLLTALISVGGKSYAHDIEVANADGVTIYYNFINNQTELAVTYQGSSYQNADYADKVVIPELVTYEGKGYPVTSIGELAFYMCSGLTEVSIGNGVTFIGDYAFCYCSGLTEVAIPNNVTSIGTSAFSQCIGLEKIVVENGNPNYDSRENCNAIIETNSNELIAGCKNTIIPNSVTSIGHNAFVGCSGLTKLTIPNNVTSIGDYAFYGCSGLTELTIGDGVTSIGHFAFENCSGLTRVTIGDGVTSIGVYAFASCDGLTELTIPNSVTNIGGSAFWNCSSLTEVTIGSSVTSIEISAFSGCSSLTTLYSLSTVPPSADSRSFNGSHYTTVDLFVPEEALEAYQTADVWKEFEKLQAIGNTTAVAEVTVAEQIQTANGQIIVTGLTDGTAVTVYDLGGQQVGSAVSKGGQAAVNTDLTIGAVAIVKMGERSVKTVMK